jgi:hypothetical protein
VRGSLDLRRSVGGGRSSSREDEEAGDGGEGRGALRKFSSEKARSGTGWRLIVSKWKQEGRGTLRTLLADLDPRRSLALVENPAELLRRLELYG